LSRDFYSLLYNNAMLKLQQIVIIIFSASALLACGPSQEEIQHAEHANELHQLVSKHFGSEINAGTFGTWRVTSVAVGEPNPFSKRITTIIATIEVPQSAATDIMSRPAEAQFRAIGWNVCPRKTEPLWATFTGNDFLTLQAAVNGSVFIDVDCQRWNL
jgi:hypothetical protein